MRGVEMSAPTPIEALEAELRERAAFRAENNGPFTKENLAEWRAADALVSQAATIAEQEKEIERLKDENHSLGNEIDALEEEGCAADDTIRAAESRVSALSAEVGRMTRWLSMALSGTMTSREAISVRASLNGGSDHG